MPTKRLPQDAHLDHLKYQAKDLLTAIALRDTQAAQRLREFHPAFHAATDPAIFDSKLKLSDAQLAIAREYGFPNWMRLRKHIQTPDQQPIQDPTFQRALDLVDAGDASGLRTFIKNHPAVVHQRLNFEGQNYFRNPTLLEFVAENPIRCGTLPANIVEVAAVILDAGARGDQPSLDETLMLVCSGRVARECGVQVPLINLLCDAGANPNRAITAALVHGEFAAVTRLIERGAAVTLPVAAAIGQTEEAGRLLPGSKPEERHRALALAAQFGHAVIVEMLLDAGEPADRYNPVGTHSHSTPLHQAALAGHLDVVRLLVQRGARLDLKDTLFQGTPAGWAESAGKTEIAECLHLAQDSLMA